MTADAKKKKKKKASESGRWPMKASPDRAASTTVGSTRQSDSVADNPDHDWKLIGLAAVGGVLGLIASVW